MFIRTRRLVRQAIAARETRDWPAACEAYQAALARTPERADIWVQLGHVQREMADRDAALGSYRRADALRPNTADTRHQIARTLDLLGEHEAAIVEYDRTLALDPNLPNAALEAKMLRIRLRRLKSVDAFGMPDHLRFLNLGTTGTCNASCVHCPTGKAETAHVPRGTMPMALFEKIIDGIADLDLTITDQIAFGLFGDGLVDPLVVKRAQYLQDKLPEARLSVNTNGAAFNREKHAPLNDLAFVIALHCESLDSDTYNYLMQPLRFERVFPKYEQILETFPGKVVVSVPITKRNLDELPAIRTWFTERGARDVVFDPLSSRCADDRTVFDSLALDPHPIRCPPEIMNDLIVDCDGQVLICCQDFQRKEGIGDLSTESFEQVLTNVHRLRTRRILAENRHEELSTCSKCYADIRA